MPSVDDFGLTTESIILLTHLAIFPLGVKVKTEHPFFQHASLLQLTKENPSGLDGPPVSKVLNRGLRVSLQDTGVVMVEPQHAALQSMPKSIIISSGIHGNETAPIEIVDELVEKIIQGKLQVKHRVLFIIGNPIAINLQKRFEIENMNRLFCGKHTKSNHWEAKRAGKLEKLVGTFFESSAVTQRFHYDLHTAIRGSKYKKFAIYPFTDGRAWNKDQLAFLLASDINCILLGHQRAATFSYFSSHFFKADAFTVELGQVKPFGQNNRQEFQKIRQNLVRLIAGEPIKTKPFNNKDFNIFQVKEELLRQAGQMFKLNIADDLVNFSEFPLGYQIMEDSQGGYTTQYEKEAIVFPNAGVPVGQRAGLIVIRRQI